MNSSTPRSRALVGGVAAAILVFCAAQLFFVVRGPQYAEAQPGSVTVRPIVKDDGVKNLTMSGVIALAAGVIAARAIRRRESAKS